MPSNAICFAATGSFSGPLKSIFSCALASIVAAMKRHRCTWPGYIFTTGCACPLTSGSGANTGALDVKFKSWICCRMRICSSSFAPLLAYHPFSQSSNGPSMISAPAMPFATCSAVEPCLCG